MKPRIIIKFKRDPKTKEISSFTAKIPDLVAELTPEKLKEIREIFNPPAERFYAELRSKAYLRDLVKMIEERELEFIIEEEMA